MTAVAVPGYCTSAVSERIVISSQSLFVLAWDSGKGDKVPTPPSLAAARRYEEEVNKQLRRVARTMAGKALIQAIETTARHWPEADLLGRRRPPMTLCIRPFDSGDKAELGECNGTALPTDPLDARPFAAGGTGHGSPSQVHYTPHDTMACCSRGQTMDEIEHGTDDQLFHELFHGLRQMEGLEYFLPTLDPGYDNEEEFFAVLATNIYLSEKGVRHLRRNHDHWHELSASLSSSEGFLGKGSAPTRIQSENRRLVNKLFTQDAALCVGLGKSPAPFNPIREYVNHPKKYALPHGHGHAAPAGARR